MSSLREFEQHQNGTTLDGNRLERLFASIVGRFNRTKQRDVVRRWSETQLVFGWKPVAPTIGSQSLLPWLPVGNQDTIFESSGTAPSDGFQNPTRLKGTQLADINPFGGIANNQYASTISLAVSKPSILQGVYLGLSRQDGLDNTFHYGAIPPAGYSPGDPMDDLFVLVSVDDPYKREDRRLSQQVIYKGRFRLDGFDASTAALVPVSDMSPPSGIVIPDYIGGAWVDLRHLRLPLPGDCRLRVSFVIPRYSAGIDTGWKQDPWARQAVNGSVTLLERV